MKSKKEINNIILGTFLLLGMHSAAFVVLKILASVILKFNTALAANIIFPIFYIGVLQLLYVVPAVIWLKRKKQTGRMKGVIIGAVITALLNIIFLALLLYSKI